MFIRYGFKISIETAQPTTVLTRLDIHPERRADIRSEQAMMVSGRAAPPAHVDMHGSLCRRVLVQPGISTLQMQGIIADSGTYDHPIARQPAVPVGDLPTETLPYLLASRYCEVDALSAFAWQKFGQIADGAPRVRAIVDMVHQHLRFDYAAAKSTRTACDALRERVGVCRDFAHLTVALCRALNIPARYVNGYLGDIGVPRDPAPMDFSAWVEVYLGGRWYTVDARHNRPRIGRIVIARGQDAADVPMIHTFGPHVLKEFVVTADEIGPSEARNLPFAA